MQFGQKKSAYKTGDKEGGGVYNITTTKEKSSTLHRNNRKDGLRLKGFKVKIPLRDHEGSQLVKGLRKLFHLVQSPRHSEATAAMILWGLTTEPADFSS